MSKHHGSPSDGGRVTLETLKEEMYSLNMRLRLAMQIHDEETGRSLEQQIRKLEQQIDEMKFGRYGV